MKNMPLISVIIPTYNEENTIGKCLSSLAGQTLKNEHYEILVIDTGSTDNTINVAKLYPVEIFLSSERSAGIGRNIGIDQSMGNIIVFIDADGEADENLLSNYRKAFIQKSAHIVGGRLKPANKETSISRVEGSLWNIYKNTWATGNIAYRKEIFSTIGKFDPEFTIAEDIEFAYRAISSGFSVTFDEACIVTHPVLNNFNDIVYQALNYGIWDAKLLKKHPQILSLIYHQYSIFLRFYNLNY